MGGNKNPPGTPNTATSVPTTRASSIDRQEKLVITDTRDDLLVESLNNLTSMLKAQNEENAANWTKYNETATQRHETFMAAMLQLMSNNTPSTVPQLHTNHDDLPLTDKEGPTFLATKLDQLVPHVSNSDLSHSFQTSSEKSKANVPPEEWSKLKELQLKNWMNLPNSTNIRSGLPQGKQPKPRPQTGLTARDVFSQYTSDGIKPARSFPEKIAEFEKTFRTNDNIDNSIHCTLPETICGVAEDHLIQIEVLDRTFSEDDATSNQRAGETYPDPVIYNGDGDPESFEKTCFSILERLRRSKTATSMGRLNIVRANFVDRGLDWFIAKEQVISRQLGESMVLPAIVLRAMRGTLDRRMVKDYQRKFFRFEQGTLSATDYILTMYKLAARTGVEIPRSLLREMIFDGLNKRISNKLIEHRLDGLQDLEELNEYIIAFDESTMDDIPSSRPSTFSRSKRFHPTESEPITKDYVKSETEKKEQEEPEGRVFN